MVPTPHWVDPAIWGPSGWRVLQVFAKNGALTPEEKKRWFESLRFVLPCIKCQANYATHWAREPFPRGNVARWLHRLHNRVNASLGRPIKSWSTAQRVPEATLEDVWTFVQAVSHACVGARAPIAVRNAFDAFFTLLPKGLDARFPAWVDAWQRRCSAHPVRSWCARRPLQQHVASCLSRAGKMRPASFETCADVCELPTAATSELARPR